MGRLAFLIGYKGQDSSETPRDAALENLVGTFTCNTRVADFLGIVAKQYVSTEEANRDRKA